MQTAQYTPRKVMVANGKGGTGKSTLAQILGCAYRCDWVDLDPQKTMTRWGRRRGECTIHQPVYDEFQAIDVEATAQMIAALPAPLVVDTPGSLVAGALYIAQFCDRIVIPTSGRTNDIETLEEALQNFGQYGMKERCLLVLTRIRPHHDIEEILGLLEPFGVPICPHVMGERAAHEYAQDAGQVAMESDPRSQAAQEAAAIVEWISSHD